MKNFNKIFFSVLICFVFCPIGRTAELSKKLHEWKVSIGSVNQFKIKNQNHRVYNNIIHDELLAKVDEEILKVKKITGLNPSQMKNHITEQKRKIELFYSSKASPYFDFVSRKTKCAKKFIPKTYEIDDSNHKMIRMSLYATNRLIYGVCSEDIAAYRSIAIYIYCKKNQTVFSVNYYIPISKTNNKLKRSITVKCL